ncbi:MAG TPA: UvrD-helicase domain-containing protein [Anaerolineales bacterium]|nr:UvrD-helicase domain-containing protein [Anaerolineales bacterium]
MIDLFSQLNPQQEQAVKASSGPILVLAGPGSGKTRVLTHRIAYLIGVLGIKPHNTLAVTFTNKAAREMENRVNQLIGDYTRGLTLGTFHAICARLLRREAEQLPFKSNFVIFDADDQVSLVKQAIRDLNLDDKRYRPGGIHAAISNAKNELILPEQFPVLNYRDEVVQRIFKRYQEMLINNNALDFDDLLLWTAKLLENNQSVRERYARRYEHILVDEFQDTNMAQYTLLKHLASFHKNIFVVGDSDQSIYRWRGADYRNILRFEKDFSNAQTILLEQNYRSTQAILNVAMAVIDHNPQRVRKQLFTDRGEGKKVLLHESIDDRAEASYVVDTIASMVAQKKFEPGDFAIMYRTNAQSRVLEEAFLTRGLPYRLLGAQRFYGRREIKDMIAYLRLIHNPQDEISLARVINVPSRGIGDKTYQLLQQQAKNQGIAPGLLILEMMATPEHAALQAFPARSQSNIHHFGKMFSNWHALENQLSPLELMDRVIQDTEYTAYINDGTEEGNDRWENVMELRRLAAEFQDKGLEAFLEQVSLVSDQDTLDNQQNVPTLLTLHAAKGLEFPSVMIIGLNEGTLPHSRSFEEPEAMMEERRLLYVGITRAKDNLILVHAQNRSMYGYTEPVEPSRYLKDIPPELLQTSQPVRVYHRNSFPDLSAATARNSPEKWTNTPQKSQPDVPVEQRFSPGDKIQHPSWGDGMVLNSRIQDGDEIVDIFFEELGLKRVMASIANLILKE